MVIDELLSVLLHWQLHAVARNSVQNAVAKVVQIERSAKENLNFLWQSCNTAYLVRSQR